MGSLFNTAAADPKRRARVQGFADAGGAGSGFAPLLLGGLAQQSLNRAKGVSATGTASGVAPLPDPGDEQLKARKRRRAAGGLPLNTILSSRETLG